MDFLILERFAYTPFGTFGRLTYNDERFFCLERPWENNKASVSCIPEGAYKVIWYNSPRFGKTLAVVGGSVSLFPEPKSQRSGILFHAGNTMDDLQGCIALGESLGYVNSKWAITDSGKAMSRFLSLKIPENCSLFIKPFIANIK